MSDHSQKSDRSSRSHSDGSRSDRSHTDHSKSSKRRAKFLAWEEMIDFSTKVGNVALKKLLPSSTISEGLCTIPFMAWSGTPSDSDTFALPAVNRLWRFTYQYKASIQHAYLGSNDFMPFEIWIGAMSMLFKSKYCAENQSYLQLRIDACHLAHTHPKVLHCDMMQLKVIKPGKVARAHWTSIQWFGTRFSDPTQSKITAHLKKAPPSSSAPVTPGPGEALASSLIKDPSKSSDTQAESSVTPMDDCIDGSPQDPHRATISIITPSPTQVPTAQQSFPSGVPDSSPREDNHAALKTVALDPTELKPAAKPTQKTHAAKATSTVPPATLPPPDNARQHAIRVKYKFEFPSADIGRASGVSPREHFRQILVTLYTKLQEEDTSCILLPWAQQTELPPIHSPEAAFK